MTGAVKTRDGRTAAIGRVLRSISMVEACPRCKKDNLVRFETVIKAGQAARHYYCGNCDYSWQTADDPKGTITEGDPPDRSRSPRHPR